MEKASIGIIGTGTMGMGIAQVAATAGHRVLLYDSQPAALVKARDQLQVQLQKLAQKEKISSSDAVAIFGRFYFIEQLEALSECSLVIEAIVEDIEVKKVLYRQIEPVLSGHCILASNTSSLSITALAASLQHAERFIGIHFFNPAPVMPLVEIIPALQTDTDIVDQVFELISGWGKIPVKAKDTPGFIVNRVARPYYTEAIRILEEGIADAATIDHAMRSVYGFRMGPFELMDFIGNDINFAVTQSLWQSCFHESRYKPSATQQRLVAAGWLGRKTGKGFYEYSAEPSKANPADPLLLTRIAWRILAMLINEAADAWYYQIANMEDIELAMTKGVNYPKGLFAWARETGIVECIETMDELYAQYHEERYRCSPGLKKLLNEAMS